jgi:hypothetical protein
LVHVLSWPWQFTYNPENGDIAFRSRGLSSVLFDRLKSPYGTVFDIGLEERETAAHRIGYTFISESGVGPSLDLLNGFPRHAGEPAACLKMFH